MRWTTMKTVIEAKRWHAIFRSDDTLFRHYWRENHPVHSLPSCFTGFSLANALFPRMIFAACHFVFIRDRDTSMNYSPRNERIVSIDFFLLLSLSFFLSSSRDIDRSWTREREGTVWNFEVVLSLHVSRSIIRRSRTARTVPDYIEITRYNAI